MTIKSAIKKLEKNGYAVTSSGNIFLASKTASRHVIGFHRNGRQDEVTCISVRSHDDHSDARSDYVAGTYVDTITGAIRLVGCSSPKA